MARNSRSMAYLDACVSDAYYAFVPIRSRINARAIVDTHTNDAFREAILCPLYTRLCQFQARSNINDRVDATRKLSACTSVGGTAVKKPMAP